MAGPAVPWVGARNAPATVRLDRWLSITEPGLQAVSLSLSKASDTDGFGRLSHIDFMRQGKRKPPPNGGWPHTVHRLRRLKPSIEGNDAGQGFLSGVVVFARSLINKNPATATVAGFSGAATRIRTDLILTKDALLPTEPAAYKARELPRGWRPRRDLNPRPQRDRLAF